MTNNSIDQMWNQAMNEAIKNGEAFTRYRFANLVAAAKAEVALAEAYRCGYEAGATAEREACAKIAEMAEPYKCADLIRARGEKV